VFTVANIPDWSSYSSLFDQYMIRLIEVLIEPTVTENTSTAVYAGSLSTVVDLDDSNPPTSVADLGAYTNLQIGTGTKSHYHRWVPTIATAVYSGAFTSFGAAEHTWVDVASPNVQHYGLKGAATATVGGAFGYTYTYKLHISFRARH